MIVSIRLFNSKAAATIHRLCIEAEKLPAHKTQEATAETCTLLVALGSSFCPLVMPLSLKLVGVVAASGGHKTMACPVAKKRQIAQVENPINSFN